MAASKPTSQLSMKQKLFRTLSQYLGALFLVLVLSILTKRFTRYTGLFSSLINQYSEFNFK